MDDAFPQPTYSKVDAKKDIYNGGIFTEDWKISAQNLSFIQRGSFTLAGGQAFIQFPRPYLSAKSSQNITFIVTSQTANHVYVDSIAKNSAFGSNNISTVCGFSITGTGTDNGFWLTIGYK